MAHIHYKFSSKLSYDTLLFDGPHISLADLKEQIMGREKLRAGCDLQITNAQTKEEYTEEGGLIPKGSSVIVRRVPGVRSGPVKKTLNIERLDVHSHRISGNIRAMDDHSSTNALPLFSKMVNLADADVPEDEKIKVVMNQSSYDPTLYHKTFGAPLPANYTCYRCGNTGHHIRHCPTSGDKNFEAPPKMKKSTGIPRSFMFEVDDPTTKGAMLTNCGRYAIPAIDAEAYAVGKKEKHPFIHQEPEPEEEKEAVPEELQCLICGDLLVDAVVIPCCGNSYCDDCIRTALLESEGHVCPTCNLADVSPDSLITNKFLRQAVNNFKKEKGYSRSLGKTSTAPQSLGSAPTPSPVPHKIHLLNNTLQSEISQPGAHSAVSLPNQLPSNETKTQDPLVPSVLPSNQACTPVHTDPKQHAGPGPGSMYSSSSSSVCPTGLPAEPPSSSHPPALPPLFSSHHFHPFHPGQRHPSHPNWTQPSPQVPHMPPLLPSSMPPLTQRDWFSHQHQERERSPHARSSRRHSSRSKSKSSRSSSRSSRSRSRSHGRSRPRSPYSRHKVPHSRSYSYGYKRSRSPTPSSSSSPRQGSQSERRHRHHSKRSSHSSHKSSRRADHSPSPGRTTTGDPGRRHASLDAGGDHYQQWKLQYKEWYEKYFSSYVSHYHHLPPPLLSLPPPPNPMWAEQVENQASRGLDAPAADRRSPPSQSSSESRSASSSRSPPSASSSDCSSPPSEGSAPRRGSAKKDRHAHFKSERKRTRKDEDEKTCSADVKDRKEKKKRRTESMAAGDQIDLRAERKGEGKEREGAKKSRRGQDEERRRSKGEKDSHSEGGRIEREDQKKRNRESGGKKALPVRTTDIWQPGMKVKPQKKISININLDGKKPAEKSQIRQSSPSERTVEKPQEDMEVMGDDDTSQANIPDAELESKAVGEEDEDVTLSLEQEEPTAEEEIRVEDIWQAGMKVKPQKKISININLDGKKPAEKSQIRQMSPSERTVEKPQEDMEVMEDGDTSQANIPDAELESKAVGEEDEDITLSLEQEEPTAEEEIRVENISHEEDVTEDGDTLKAEPSETEPESKAVGEDYEDVTMSLEQEEESTVGQKEDGDTSQGNIPDSEHQQETETDRENKQVKKDENKVEDVIMSLEQEEPTAEEEIRVENISQEGDVTEDGDKLEAEPSESEQECKAVEKKDEDVTMSLEQEEPTAEEEISLENISQEEDVTEDGDKLEAKIPDSEHKQETQTNQESKQLKEDENNLEEVITSLEQEELTADKEISVEDVTEDGDKLEAEPSESEPESKAVEKEDEDVTLSLEQEEPTADKEISLENISKWQEVTEDGDNLEAKIPGSEHQQETETGRQVKKDKNNLEDVIMSLKQEELRADKELIVENCSNEEMFPPDELQGAEKTPEAERADESVKEEEEDRSETKGDQECVTTEDERTREENLPANWKEEVKMMKISHEEDALMRMSHSSEEEDKADSGTLPADCTGSEEFAEATVAMTTPPRQHLRHEGLVIREVVQVPFLQYEKEDGDDDQQEVLSSSQSLDQKTTMEGAEKASPSSGGDIRDEESSSNFLSNHHADQDTAQEDGLLLLLGGNSKKDPASTDHHHDRPSRSHASGRPQGRSELSWSRISAARPSVSRRAERSRPKAESREEQWRKYKLEKMLKEGQEERARKEEDQDQGERRESSLCSSSSVKMSQDVRRTKKHQKEKSSSLVVIPP
ncbi:E3 ubiquitin-protein ligase RBBP6-like isoform X2 [Entelurus aequoreus]|uniref:E3 ubiquitin-protein ligase RBBP6-like isoform X2 n=1 Tax=Entelurus aequoreus TaxID=161455 RepID=UPI002B1D26F3|nr:E3 ubiquitin-protein ligase RBBP6-like isoform X2 [Entelurus aequoreus]